MPLLALLEIAIQGFCIYHATQTGRTNPWLYICAIPGIGPLAYFLFVLLPDMADTRRGRKVVVNVQTVLDPDGEYRKRRKQVELTGTPANKAALADECSRKGMHEDAVELYRSALVGFYADDPNLLMGFARVLLEKGDFAETQKTLDHLREKNPDFQSSDGHLLYTRALEGQGKNDEAIKEYDALVSYFPGHEAKVRFALFQQKLGNPSKAREILEGVIQKHRDLPPHARDLNHDWFDVARRVLAGKA
jgi:hypothetical protein